MTHAARINYLYGGVFVAAWTSMMWGLPFRWALIIALASVFSCAMNIHQMGPCGKQFRAPYGAHYCCILEPGHDEGCVSSNGSRERSVTS